MKFILGIKKEAVKIVKVKINDQNKNGLTILKSLLFKKPLISHCRPSSSAPERSKNKSTPILVKLFMNNSNIPDAEMIDETLKCVISARCPVT